MALIFLKLYNCLYKNIHWGGRILELKDFLQDISDDVKTINSSDFKVEVIETKQVPNPDDKDLTYENFDTLTKKCKSIETCVLYIDIRKSTQLSSIHRNSTLVKLYSSFIRSMVKAGEYYDGKVRNIVGDRVMVVFNSDSCFTSAVNTAILMNTIADRIINKHFKNNEVKCGIGIDYGKMLVSKVGTIKQGNENSQYKSLVWLGNAANIASKLTDAANKPNKNNKNISPILMSKAVYDGFKKLNPGHKSIKENYWTIQDVEVSNYSDIVYGGNVYFTDINKTK